MNQSIFNRSGFLRTLFLLALLAVLPASPQSASSRGASPIGHWVAEHPSQGGIASWWNFRSDGTLTMYVGAAVTSPITRSGDTFIAPAVTTTGPPITVTFHIEGDTLHLKASTVPEQILTRVGPAPSATDPLLGKWKPVPPATPSNDPSVAAQQKALANAIFVFSADGTESVRAPFTSFEGTWDANSHTFHVDNQAATFNFQRTGSKLTLGLPPDGHRTDTYIPDPIL